MYVWVHDASIIRWRVLQQESVPLLPPREESGPGLDAGDADHSEEEGDGDAADEYEGRDDELDAPRDYDDYTDNAHHPHHHD